MRLIDIEPFETEKGVTTCQITRWRSGDGYAEVVTTNTKDIPAADVAPVVRCKNCIRCEEERTMMGHVLFCRHWVRNTTEDGYCHEGWQMDGERNVPEANVGKMTNWKLTDVDESGYEYECPHCFCHIGARVKGRDLPEECPNCGAYMRERKGDE